MTDESRTLVAKRARIKAQITRFRTYLKKWADNPDEQELKERLEKIKTTWDLFDEIQTKLEIIDKDSNNETERVSFEDSYFELVSQAQRNLAALVPSVPVDNTTPISQAYTVQNVKTGVKLPTINLPVFSGKYDAWLGFYDIFKSIVPRQP